MYTLFVLLAGLALEGSVFDIMARLSFEERECRKLGRKYCRLASLPSSDSN